jgi:heme oxygenase
MCDMMPNPATIHTTLKEGTRDLHRTLEARLSPILSEALSLDQYTEILKKLYAFYQPIESQLLCISPWGDTALNLQQRRKLPFLFDDLVSLHVDPDQIAAIPFCTHLPTLESVPQALGCLYVLEGSTLGGKIITSRLKENLHLDPARGCGFFNSYGKDVGILWRGFLDALSQYTQRHGNEQVILASACQTFAAMDQWLAAPLLQPEFAHV